jgi:hypothetical protein
MPSFLKFQVPGAKAVSCHAFNADMTRLSSTFCSISSPD